MKTLIYFCMFLLTVSFQAQESVTSSTKYRDGMNEAFRLWQEGKPLDAANLFERIAQSQPDNWLPSYYAAQIYVVSSFSEKDEKELTAQLKKAQNFINDATAISKENADILVLQAQLFTSWIIFDGQRYGMQYSPKATEYYNRAVAVSPDNPRAVLAKAEWNIGSAKYFGESTKKYCDEIERAITLFENEPKQEEFFPSYGLERAKQIRIANCN